MKTAKIILSTFLCLQLAVPFSELSAQSTDAQSGWTDKFLRNLKVSYPGSAAAAPPPGAVIGQLFQTGTVPISLHEVIDMMMANNLDIRSNRFSPRTSALQALVFYRALEPSIRFSGTVIRDTSAPTSQTSGALTLSSLRHQFAVGFAQQLPWGTSVSV